MNTHLQRGGAESGVGVEEPPDQCKNIRAARLAVTLFKRAWKLAPVQLLEDLDTFADRLEAVAPHFKEDDPQGKDVALALVAELRRSVPVQFTLNQ